MKGRFIEDWFANEYEPQKGDYGYFSRQNGTLGFFYCCPKCGKVSSGTDKHKFNKATSSVKPSIVHKCGYHGHLINGEFTHC